MAEGSLITKDGSTLSFDMGLNPNLWAMQWSGTSGEVEYTDGTPNRALTDLSDFQHILDTFDVQMAAKVAKDSEQRAADIANRTYQEIRQGQYPDVGDQLDDLFHSGYFSTEMAAKIQAVKTANPKGSKYQLND